ncbi:MAG: type II toxin-antitoxin system RatA family toxin [Halopenitus sp.]
MDELVVRTEVYAPQQEVYDLLEDLERYDQYSEYLRRVRRGEGDGGAGTRYALEFAWWKLTYTAESEVTDVDPPNRIDWRITKDIDAHGEWRVEPMDGDETACEVIFVVNFDPGSANSSAIDLPLMVSFDWVLAKAIPLFQTEAECIVERAVADLEGRERDIDLDVTVDSDHI